MRKVNNNMPAAKKILSNAEIISLALFFPRNGTLVLGDLHLGKEEGLANQGVLVPRTSFAQIMKEIEKIFARAKEIKGQEKVKKVVLMGDVKNEFGRPGAQEWKEVLALFNFLKAHAERVIVLKGNHDNYIKLILKAKEAEFRDYFIENEVLFCHGDKIIEGTEAKKAGAEKCKFIVVGHAHPAFILNDEYKTEKFKCFAARKQGNKKIVVMPSLNPLSKGTDILRGELISPYLLGAKEFEIWAVEEGQVFYFGRKKRVLE